MRTARVVFAAVVSIAAASVVWADLSTAGASTSKPDGALSRAVTEADGHVAVAAIDLATGNAVADDAATDRFFTASIVKVDIAAVLLHEHQVKHKSLSAQDSRLLRTMLDDSDNDSASALWDAVGGATAVNRFNKRLGLDHTTAGVDGLWGLTSTTADDQLRLLDKVLVGDVLSDRYQKLLLHYMRSVVSGQRWGISSADSDSADLAIKDGWLPHAADDYRWILNSIGLIGTRNHGVLIVVLSNHSTSESAGIRRVEEVAKLAREDLAKAA